MQNLEKYEPWVVDEVLDRYPAKHRDHEAGNTTYMVTRSLGAQLLGSGPSGRLWALRACLTTTSTPFGRSGRVTHITKIFFLQIFISAFFSYFSGRFDTSGYILPFLVPEISPGDGFCDAEDVQELGILGVR